MKIRTKDAIVQSVLKKMDERSLIGQKKYGATMMQEIEGQEKDLNRFLIDVPVSYTHLTLPTILRV